MDGEDRRGGVVFEGLPDDDGVVDDDGEGVVDWGPSQLADPSSGGGEAGKGEEFFARCDFVDGYFDRVAAGEDNVCK